jgi:hypothetical protein
LLRNRVTTLRLWLQLWDVQSGHIADDPLRRGLATVDDLPPCPRIGGALGDFAGLPYQVEDDARGDGPSRSSICRWASVINAATSRPV